MNKTALLFIVSGLTIINVTAQQARTRGAIVNDFVPEGWKNIIQASGDLNKDGFTDEVIIIENTDPANFRAQDGFGPDTLNLNPRTLLVLFKEPSGGFLLVARNDKSFIPAPNDDINPCLADPLMEDGGMEIVNGVLKIDFNYWLSCGSWYVNHATYTFRYQYDHFELIGFDHSEYHRSSGESSATSINFSTKKIEKTAGGNMFDDTLDKPETTRRKFATEKLYRLEDCDSEVYRKILDL